VDYCGDVFKIFLSCRSDQVIYTRHPIVMIMTDYIIMKKLRDTTDVKKLLDTIYAGEDEHLTKKQLDDILDDIGYSSMTDMIGSWVDAGEINACGMPAMPDKKDFDLAIRSVFVIVGGRHSVEKVPIHEWKHSGLGLIGKEVWEGLW